MPEELGVQTSQGVFFEILPPEVHVIAGYRYLLSAREAALREFPGGEGRARALAIDVVLREVEVRVDGAAVTTAQEAEQIIVALIDKTQVRPDPPGKGHGPRLRDVIDCVPLKTALPGGGVGIAKLSTLDQAVGTDGTPYWKAQEFGYSGNVGRRLPGYFQPGESPAGDAPPRTHPIFEVRAREGAPAMLIRQPIHERRFLRDGVVEAEVFRQKAIGDAVSPAIPELRLIQTGNHPRIKAAETYLKGRGGRA